VGGGEGDQQGDGTVSQKVQLRRGIGSASRIKGGGVGKNMRKEG